MQSFNVIIYDFNARCFTTYDVIPHLVDRYREAKKKHSFDNRDEVVAFIKGESMYQWWCRCEYEMILSDWPTKKTEEKWDIYRQIMMKLDIIVDIVINNG